MAKKKDVSPDDVTQNRLEMDDFGELDDLDFDAEAEGEPKGRLTKETPKKESAPPAPKPEKEKKKVEKAGMEEELLELSGDIPVRLAAVLGNKQMPLKEVLKLRVGQSLNLERPPNEFVDLVANGKVIARGELVEIDGKLGVRIIKLTQ